MPKVDFLAGRRTADEELCRVMMSEADWDYRPLGLDGVKTLVDWARLEGWNPGPHDAEAFFRADEQGFLGVFRGDEMVGGGAIVAYEEGAFGFMGLFIVKPEHRSAGIGRRLWYRRRDTLRARLKPGAAIGMDGVVAMQPFYQRGGFEIAFRDERHERLGERMAVPTAVSRLETDRVGEVLALDRACFGCDRERFLRHWMRVPGALTFQHVDDGRLTGFAVLRPVTTGWKIGPLFAMSPAAAEGLYVACLNAAPGEPVVLDVPATHAEAMALVRRRGTTCAFECARMYQGAAPAVAREWIYGVTTFELG